MYLLDTQDEPTISNVSDDIKQLLIDKKIINTHGDILNASQYRREIAIARDNRLKKLEKIPLINGQLIDMGRASVLLEEIYFLNTVANHKKNFIAGLEYMKPRSKQKPEDRNVWQNIDRIRRKMLVVFRRRFR